MMKGNRRTYDRPTPDEKKTREDRLRERGCGYGNCDVTDPDKLQFVQYNLPPNVQYPPGPSPVACDEHVDNVKLQNQCCTDPDFERDDPEPEMVTEIQQVGWDENDDPIYEEVEVKHRAPERYVCQNCGSEFTR